MSAPVPVSSSDSSSTSSSGTSSPTGGASGAAGTGALAASEAQDILSLVGGGGAGRLLRCRKMFGRTYESNETRYSLYCTLKAPKANLVVVGVEETPISS